MTPTNPDPFADLPRGGVWQVEITRSSRYAYSLRAHNGLWEMLARRNAITLSGARRRARRWVRSLNRYPKIVETVTPS